MQKIKSMLFYILLFLLSFGFSTTALGYDYDLWARLIVGKAIIQTGHVLTHDFLSYTPTHQWIDHEWGSSVIFYLTEHILGPYGIILLQTLLTFLIFVFVYKTVELHLEKSVSKYNIAFYFFGFYAIQEIFQYPVRCQMFTFLFFAVFLYILELARIKNVNKPLFLIPILIIIWNNLHGGLVAGLGLLIIYVLGEYLNRKPVKKYIYTFLACLPLLLINPYGIAYLKFLAMANTMERSDIIEWWGLFSKYHFWGYFEFKIFALLMLIIELVKTVKGGFSYKKLDKTKFLILFITLWLALDHVKLIRFFIISSLCLVYNDFYVLIKNFKMTKWKNIAIYTMVLCFCFSLIRLNDTRPKVNFVFPVLETEFVKINNLKGNILVNLGLGSYVAYKLYPNNLIYMDGRYEEVYYNEMVPLLKKFHLLAQGWDEVLKKYPPDVMILENGYPIIEMLSYDKEWQKAYVGRRFTVFVNKKIAKGSYELPTMNYTYYENTLFDTNIDFRKINNE